MYKNKRQEVKKKQFFVFVHFLLDNPRFSHRIQIIGTSKTENTCSKISLVVMS